MSSLRLALKQSLEEAGTGDHRGGAPPPQKKKRRGPGRPPKRRPGDPPRKRGRPRKHPLPEEQQPQQKEEQEHYSSSEAEFSVGDESESSQSSSDEEHARLKKHKLQKKKHERAANTIQNHWKKKKKDKEEEKPTAKKSSSPEQPTKKKGKAKTVPPPTPELVAWTRNLSVKKQKKHVAAGMRVKVRFATNVRKRDGKIVRRLKWYGGLVTGVSTGGSKVRIKYDDGTSEISKFPDKDIIVDDEGNGEHRVPATKFIPPAQRHAAAAEKEGKAEKRKEEMVVSPTPPVRSAAKAAEKAFKSADHDDDAHEHDEHDHDDHEYEHADHEHEHDDDDGDRKQPAVERDTTAEDDSREIKAEIPRKESKPNLTIRLKTPKSKPPPSPSPTFEEEEHHMEEESAHEEEEEMSVEKEEEKPRAKSKSPPAQEEKEMVIPKKKRKKKRRERSDAEESAEEEQPAKKRVARSPSQKDVVARKSPPVPKKAPSDEHVEEAADEKEDENAPEQGRASKTMVDVAVPRKMRERSLSKSPRVSSASPEEEPPSQLSDDLKKSASEAELSRPVSTAAATSTTDAPKEEEAEPKSGQVLTSSKNSAFDRKEKVRSKDHSEGKQPIDEPQELPEEENRSDDSASKAMPAVPRSGRRAAQQANQRIAARQEIVIQDPYAKKKKRREKTDLKLFPSSERKRKARDEDVADDDDDDREWVQCDKCMKWRILPENVQTEKLPKHWYCEMNIYDKVRNTCDAPEQTAQEIAKEKRRRRRKLAKLARLEAAGELDPETAEAQRTAIKEGRKPERVRERSTRSPMPEPKRAKDDDTEANAGSATESKRKRGSPVSSEGSARPADSPQSDSGNEPQKSGSRKQWSISGRRSRQDDAEEAVNMEVEPAEEPAPPVKVKRGRGRPRSNKNAGDKDVKGKKGGKDKDPDNQEWVMCEKCSKWRRLPPHVSADSLPEVWYCTMNTWDPRNATCDAEEDTADPNTREFNIFGSGVNASYGNKLSYRNLIFGTGRKQNRPVSERTRAAESLFSTPVDPSADSTAYPTVMYANSSVFISRSGNTSKANAPEVPNKISLFELMSHSNLWAELRGVSSLASMPDKPASAHATPTYDGFSDSMKNTMKQIVFHALGSGTMACHEVLLEAQCRQWNDVPKEWAEIRASCTIDIVQAALRALAADGHVEVVNDDSGETKYRRTPPKEPKRTTRCIKIAKPWKKASVGIAHQ